MKILKILWFILLIFSICSCNNSKNWDEVVIDKNISQDRVYKRLDTEQEIFSIFEPDTFRKKSSDVEYLIGENMPDEYSKMYDCHAFFKLDTLWIRISSSTDGHSSHGFIIKYKENTFFTEPYYWQDAEIPDEYLPTYKLVYQKLVLDKSNYKTGDSLY